MFGALQSPGAASNNNDTNNFNNIPTANVVFGTAVQPGFAFGSPQYAPPPLFGAAMAAAASAQPCQSTSEFLSQRFAESNYGTNAAAFNAYFVPSSSPPRCIVCSRLIGDHAAAVTTPAVVNMPGLGITAAASTGTPVAPENIERGATQDVIKSNGIGWIFLFVSCFLFLIASGILIGFGAGGLLKLAPFVVVGPSIMLIISFVLGVFAEFTTVTVDKQRHTITTSSWRVPFCCGGCCCGKSSQFSFSDVVAIRVEGSNVSINHVPQMKINLVYRNVNDGNAEETVELGLAGMWHANDVAAGWLQYFRDELGISQITRT